MRNTRDHIEVLVPSYNRETEKGDYYLASFEYNNLNKAKHVTWVSTTEI